MMTETESRHRSDRELAELRARLAAEKLRSRELSRRLKRLEQNADSVCDNRDHRFFDAMAEGFVRAAVIFDDVGRPFDYRLLEMNRAAGRLIGYDPATAVGRTLRELLADPDREWLALLDRVALSGTPARFERYSPSLGKWFSVNAFRPEYGRIAGMFIDISERKQAEKELRHSRLLLAEAEKLSHTGAWEWDLVTGRLSCSDEWLAIHGCREQMLTPDELMEIAHPDDRDTVRRALEATAHGLAPYDLKHRIVRRDDGAVRCVHGHGRSVSDETGRVVKLYGFAQDITERRRVEEALQDSEQRVRQKLKSVLSPEGEPGELELADLIDAPALQRMMDDFFELARIPMSIIDTAGRILVGVGWQDICTRFHRVHPDTCRHCLESDTRLASGLAQGEYRLYKCKNNLWDMATPIVVGGRQLGKVFTGQFFFEDEEIDRELFREQARTYGFAEQEYLDALDRVPRLSRTIVDRGMGFFLKLADTLSELGHSNVKLARLLAERDRLTGSLRESEERLRLFIDHAPASLAMFDRDLRYLSVSRRWLSDYNLGERDLIGLIHYEVSPGVPEAWKAIHRRALAGEVVRSECDRFERPDGSVQMLRWEVRPWRDRTGAVAGIVIFSEDISERHRAEESLRDSEERLRRAQEIAHLGSWELDLLSNELSWSDEVYRIFGLRPQEFGATYEAFLAAVHPEDRDLVNEAYSSSLRENRDSYEVEHRVVRPDGEIRHVHEKCAHSRDASGRITRSMGMVHDITERMLARQALQRSNRELEQFASVASHDLQEPLRAIIGFLQLLQTRFADRLDAQGNHYIERSVRAGHRLQTLIRELLALSRVHNRGEDFVPTDLNHTVTAVLESLQPLIEEKRAVIACEDLPTLPVDPGQMHSLFQNLLINGLRYNESPAAHLKISCRAADNGYRFAIQDNGIGIPPEFQERIYVVFQRLHSEREYPGTGMGLALCKKIVERHGGAIWVESLPREGSTFYFTLPGTR